MPYIDKEKVKEYRDKIKKQFPGIKCSVTREHYSSIRVALMESNLPELSHLDGQYKQINNFYITEHYAGDPFLRDILNGINDIIEKDNSELVYDSDYGSVPHYYTNIHIGRWDKPFIFNKS